MADGPDISGDGGDVGVRQRRAAFRWHRDRIIPRLRNAVGGFFCDPSEAIAVIVEIAPRPALPDRNTPAGLPKPSQPVTSGYCGPALKQSPGTGAVPASRNRRPAALIAIT
jgi:hypothetical protein